MINIFPKSIVLYHYLWQIPRHLVTSSPSVPSAIPSSIITASIVAPAIITTAIRSVQCRRKERPWRGQYSNFPGVDQKVRHLGIYRQAIRHQDPRQLHHLHLSHVFVEAAAHSPLRIPVEDTLHIQVVAGDTQLHILAVGSLLPRSRLAEGNRRSLVAPVHSVYH